MPELFPPELHPKDIVPRSLEQLLANRFMPVSTYRLQLHKNFTFADATKVTPYLKSLGIGTAYASPYLTAVPGSMHGYDVIDHAHLNPELLPEQFDAWIDSLRSNGLTHIVDIVPNHMGIATNLNAWWNDVLENGPDAEHGKFFDIAWTSSPRASLQNKVLLPVLGASYAEALENAELKLTREGGALFVNYYDRRFPIAPDSMPALLGTSEPLKTVGDAFSSLPANAEERSKRVADLRQNLSDRSARDPEFAKAIDQRITVLNGVKGDSKSFDALDALLDRQFYRLASWRTAADEINYRRFFDVGSLAAIAMERPEVFEQSHALILNLLAREKIQGLRLDHPDGLYDPAAYFDRLQNAFVAACANEKLESIDAGIAAKKPLYVLGEKILAMNESLPTEWPIDGTTGYDFLIQVNAGFVDTENETACTTLYQDFTGETHGIEEISHACKLLILDRAMSSELDMLTHQLDHLSQQHRVSRDFTFMGLRSALRELIASFSVYRTYITAAPISERDRSEVDKAVAKAKSCAPKIDGSLFDYVRSVLLRARPADDATRVLQVKFAGKFQQLTSPVTAKGIEDTAFYRYHRLISLNEVGGEPARFGITADSLHTYLADRQKHWPFALSTLSTHDTKRSEDVRARINVLSEIPKTWASHVYGWRNALAPLNLGVHRNDEYLIYQTLIGAWPTDDEPDFAQRLHEYFKKALREAKDRTNWTAPDETYEKKVHALIDAVIDKNRSAEFHKTFQPFLKRIIWAGRINSLSQTVLKFFGPGLPDTYQGTELWDLSLVDPDNRRPVDYARRQTLLKNLNASSDPKMLSDMLDDGRAKLWVTTQGLHLRRRVPKLFEEGTYTPLHLSGPHARHAFAFLRRCGSEALVVIVPRFVERLREAAGSSEDEILIRDTHVALPKDLASESFTHVFTGQRVDCAAAIDVGAALRPFPVLALHATHG